MRNFCCGVSIVLFLLAFVLAFDTERHFHTVIGGGNVPTVIVPNIVRALAALGFCIAGGSALIAAVVSRRSDCNYRIEREARAQNNPPDVGSRC
jgi:hypothetical protein